MKRHVYEKYLKPEDHTHIAVCNFLRYSKLIWFHVPNEGRRTPFERWYFTQMGAKSGIPDILILNHSNQYSGLALELKVPGTVIHNQDGSVRKSLQHQDKILQEFKKVGWQADFAVGPAAAIKMIREYIFLP